ncbi:Hypothetical protein DEACI_1578 [Acididesulfobacillus acetoxydans]|uniref:Uncharacterized protein n=1 Tax=Acididesulfobacillus acetoxydans TaxID=1561005 RepID=A0A8S0Y2K2_9FIRM|nr:Hypothetical protein DEACI_1578 [Acididesulfobacillus acetoxydans]CEJ08918.1 Hypothetical protein DEACI_3400 [Acididesulfobacillus acetoxydans]
MAEATRCEIIVVESTDTPNILGFEATKDGVRRNPHCLINLLSNADFWHRHEKEKIRSEHGSRITRLRAFSTIAVLKQRRDVIQIGHPELGNPTPVSVRDDEGPIGIMTSKMFDYGILIGRMRNQNRFQANRP